MDKTQLYECATCRMQKFYSDPDGEPVSRACERCGGPLYLRDPEPTPATDAIEGEAVTSSDPATPAGCLMCRMARAHLARHAGTADATGSP